LTTELQEIPVRASGDLFWALTLFALRVSMTEKIRKYISRRLHPGSGQMLMRHELQVLFGQIMLRIMDCALPYYVVLAGPKGIGKSLVGLCTETRGVNVVSAKCVQPSSADCKVSNKILHSAQQHHRLGEVQTVIVRLSARHNDVKLTQTYIRQSLSR